MLGKRISTEFKGSGKRTLVKGLIYRRVIAVEDGKEPMDPN